MALHTIVEHDTTHIKPYIDAKIQDVNSDIQTLSNLVEGATEITTKDYVPVISVNDALPVNAVDVSAKIEPIQAGSGTPSPTNIRPISGSTCANILCTRELAVLEQGGITDATGQENNLTTRGRTKFIKIESNKDFNYINIVANRESDDVYRSIHFYDSNKEYISYGSAINGSLPCEFTFKIPTNAKYYRVVFMKADTTSRFSVEGKTAVIGFSNKVNFDDTYYGGTLDVTTGVLTVDKGIIDLGDLTYTYESANTRFISSYVSGMSLLEATRSMEMFCSCYEAISDRRAISGVPNNSIYNAGNNAVIYIHDNRYTDGSDLKTALTGQKLVYLLATPITIQLTPQDVHLFDGENVLCADTGDIYLEYYCKSVANTNEVLGKVQNSSEGLSENAYFNGKVNLLELKDLSLADNGLIITSNSDKSITINGTALSDGSYNVVKGAESVRLFADGVLESGKQYKLSGCPDGGSASSYKLIINYVNSNNMVIASDDYGKGVYVNIPKGATGGRVMIIIAAGTVCKNLVFKPMLTLADVPNSDYAHYVPYVKSNKELTEELSDRYVVDELKSVTVTTDGVKTYETLLRELQLAFINEIKSSAYTANDRFVYNGLNIEAVQNHSPNEYILCSNTYHPAITFSSVSIDGTNTNIDYVLPAGSSEVKYYRNQNGTIIDRKSLVPPSGRTMRMYFTAYRKIS